MAIVRVQGNARGTAAGGGAPTTIAVTLGSTPVAGNILILTYNAYSGNTSTIASITQAGVTWTLQKTVNGSGLYAEIWLGVVGVSAGTSITVNLNAAIVTSSGYSGTANVCEYSGVRTALFLDKTSSATGTTVGALTGTTATTTLADELWIGTITGFSTVGTNAVTNVNTNGFTLLDGVANGYISCSFLEKIVSATAAASSSVNIGSGNPHYSGCIATFKMNPTLTTSKIFAVDKDSNLFRIAPSTMTEEKTISVA